MNSPSFPSVFFPIGTGGAAVAPVTVTVPGVTGVVYTIPHLLGSASTISLIAGTNANLALVNGNQISAAAIVLDTEVAEVREVNGALAVEYPVSLVGEFILGFSIIPPGPVPEGNSGATIHTWTIVRTSTLGVASVSWAVSGSALNPATGSDFVGGVLPSGTMTFNDGEDTKPLNIQIAGDALFEPDEGYLVTLSNPNVAYTLIVASASAIIVNDDSAPYFTVTGAVPTAEGASGTTNFAFIVSRSSSVGAASVSYNAAGIGTHPTSSSDFVGGVDPSGTVSFLDGELSKIVNVPVQGDTTVENDETFVFTLYSPSSPYLLVGGTAIATVLNDDSTSPILPATQTVAFGALTRAGGGGHALAYTGSGTLSILSGDPSGHWAIRNNMLVPAGSYGAAPPALAGPYTLSIGDGTATSTVTINIEPNVAHVNQDSGDTSGGNQLRTLVNATTAILRYGDAIKLRTGMVWNPNQGNWALRKGAAWGQRSGGPVAPTTDTDPGFVTITSESPLGAQIASMTIEGVTVRDQYLRFTSIDFYRPAIIQDAVNQYALLGSTGPSGTEPCWLLVDNCKVRSSFYPGTTEPTASNQGNICSGIKFNGQLASLATRGHIWVQDNLCSDLGDGIVVQGIDCIVRRNTVQRTWRDDIDFACHASAPGKSLCDENFLVDKKKALPATGIHPDGIQFDFTGWPAGTYIGPKFRKNVLARGQGTSGREDRQGIFMSPSGGTPAGVWFTDVEMTDNIYIGCPPGAGFTFLRCIDPILRNNTELRDQQNDDGGSTIEPKVVMRECDGGTIDRNILHLKTGQAISTAIDQQSPVNPTTVGASNVYLTPPNYPSAFVAPVYNPLASVAAVMAAFAAKSSGPANFSGLYSGALDNLGAWVDTATAPAAPAITGLTAGNGYIDVAFTDGANNGSPISSHAAYLDGDFSRRPIRCPAHRRSG